jgi:hypothetical protein
MRVHIPRPAHSQFPADFSDETAPRRFRVRYLVFLLTADSRGRHQQRAVSQYRTAPQPRSRGRGSYWFVPVKAASPKLINTGSLTIFAKKNVEQAI